MAFIDDVRGRFAQASQSTVQRAKDFSEIKRLEMSMDESRRQIHELYGKIGYEVYNAYHDAPLPEVAELIAAVTGLHEKIKACEDQIKEISGVSACPQCGAQIRKGMLFCSSCGYRLPEEKVPETQDVMFCESCGAKISADSIFCSSCGHKINR